jgi:6-phosphogluconate dehydrogenase
MSNREIGIVGLRSVMGSNLALNILDEGFPVAGLDRDAGHVRDFLERVTRECGSDAGTYATTQVDELVGALRRRRAILLVVPAGKPVDAVLTQLVTLLDRKDVVTDGGDSHFVDSDGRARS